MQAFLPFALFVLKSLGAEASALHDRKVLRHTNVAQASENPLGRATSDMVALQATKAQSSLSSLARLVAEAADGHIDAPSLFELTVRKFANFSTDCDLCGGDQGWLFILGASRRGGTKRAQRMLNSIPGVYLSDSPQSVISTLEMLYTTGEMLNSKAGRGVAFKQNLISQRKLLCSLQLFARTLVGNERGRAAKVIGFKDTNQSSQEDLDFLAKLFPCGRFVVATSAKDLVRLDGQEVTLEAESSQSINRIVDLLKADPRKIRGALRIIEGNWLVPKEPLSDVNNAALARARGEGEGGSLALDDAENAELVFNRTVVLQTWQEMHPSNTFPLDLGNSSAIRFNELLGWLGVSGCQFAEAATDNERPPHLAGRCDLQKAAK